MKKRLLVLLMCAQSNTWAAGVQFSNLIPNFAGVAVGATSEWSGSKDTIAGAVPGARYSMENNRYAEWYGTYAGMKINTHENFEFGPALVVRMARKDVDNKQVNQLPDIDTGLELGGFVGYACTNTDFAIPYYSRIGVLVTTAVAGGAKGTNVNVYANTWMPLSQKLFLGMGLGTTWASSDYTSHGHSCGFLSFAFGR